MNTPYPEVKTLGTILGIWAHPDDECFTMAGVMAAAIANGQRLVCVTATRGGQGITDTSRWPAETLGDTRERELEHALEVIGVTEHHWLGYSDGTCMNVDQSTAIGRIASIINTVKPDSIFTFGPDGLTGHDDHKTVSRWAHEAILQAHPSPTPRLFYPVCSTQWYELIGKRWDEKLHLFFNLHKPLLIPEQQADFLFKLPPELIIRKIDTLRAHESQYSEAFQLFSKKELEDMVETECFINAT